ncbi:MAG: hypothetical protein E6J01_03905 [Chloroflexi bacterium]|nr:MAG: hypothetical protein E6J01_03905 [Chloroflexota bacterium]
MSIGEFAEALAIVCQKHGGSVTSWGRTVKHSVSVGGFDGDPHTWFLGADVVYDRPGAAVATDPNKPEVEADAATLGLRVLHETTHDHFQPADWINRAHDGVAHA